MSKNLFEQALAAEGIVGKLADVARSIYQQESGSGRNTKTSNAGAHGGMQIIPATFKSVADKGWDIKDPMHNARAGIRYLKQLDKQSGGDPALTAAGYYGGPGGMEKARRGVAVFDPRNPNAPSTLEYGRQVANRVNGGKPAYLNMPDNQMPQMSDLPMAQAPVAVPPVMVAQAPLQEAPIMDAPAAVAQQVAAASGLSHNNPWAALGKAMPQQEMRPADLEYGNLAARGATATPARVFEGEADNSQMVAQVLKRFGVGRFAADMERYQTTIPEFNA